MSIYSSALKTERFKARGRMGRSLRRICHPLRGEEGGLRKLTTGVMPSCISP